MNQHPVKMGQLVQSESADGWTVYEPETDSLHVLNASAKAIWELCDGRTSKREMAEAISLLTGMSVDEAIADVDSVISELSARGLVEPS